MTERITRTCEVFEFRFDSLEQEIRELLESAREASTRAWAPFSNFNVGAAALLPDGSRHVSANQENAAYPSGMCAERVLIYYLGANFPETPLKHLAIYAAAIEDAPDDAPATPCGACLQALWQYEWRMKSPITLYLWNGKRVWQLSGIQQLLPFAFSALNGHK